MARECVLARKRIEWREMERSKSYPKFAGYVPDDVDFIPSREEFVDFNGKRALVRQNIAQHFDLKDHTKVYGYVVSDVYIDGFGCEAVKCEPVPDKDRDGLTAILLEHKFSGVIIFNS